MHTVKNRKTGLLLFVFFLCFAWSKPALALSAGDAYQVHRSITAYEDSYSAQQKTKDVGPRPAGTYFVYKQFNGMLNISTQKNVPGFWIDPAENAAPFREMVTLYRVNLRAGASKDSALSGSLPPGTQVTVSATGNDYSRINWNGSTGYVFSDYLVPIKKDPFQRLVLQSRINFRSGPGTAYDSYGKLSGGTEVRNLGEENNGFLKVNHNGTAGWISSWYVDAHSPKDWYGVPIVNKTYPVPTTYEPPKIAKDAAVMLTKMRSAYRAESGRELALISGYRSYATQSRIFWGYLQKNGYDAASMYSARPGYSEHQTGLAFDLNGSKASTLLKESFQDTLEYRWLAGNAHKYGFILRYPKAKTAITGFIFEPWHYRFVGPELATDMKKYGATLEEYTGLH